MPNRLATQTSPYLQQHAGNPVDWFPWEVDALRLAREQDRPILLSIGYSACLSCPLFTRPPFTPSFRAQPNSAGNYWRSCDHSLSSRL